jgi:hypothetical protein
VFLEDKLNEDPYNVPLLSGPCTGLPIDFTGVKKTKTKIQFRMVYDEMPKEGSSRKVDLPSTVKDTVQPKVQVIEEPKE